MSAEATRSGDWLTAPIAGCDRLVSPSVSGEERARQRRLIGVLLAGPFVAAPATLLAASSAFGAAGALAMLCAVFAGSWVVALHLAAGGSARKAEWAALGGGAALAGALVALCGGAASPLAVLLLALPLEAVWVGRSRGAATAGIAAAVGALALALALGMAQGPDASVWQWLSPALYAATLLARRLALEAAAPDHGAAGARDLPETCLDGAVAWLGRAGEVEDASPQAKEVLGVEPELLLGSGLFERIHVADRVAFRCAAAQVLEEGRPRRCEIRVRMPMTADGEGGGYRPFDIEIVRPRAGEDAVAAIIRDGRETAALREELARAQERAEMTDIAKSRFLAAVSHELRTPLNAIIGFSDMLLHREISGALDARQAEHVGLIREAGNHLLSVVNAILDVSKIEAGAYHITVEPFDVRPAIELCCAMLKPQADAKGVTLSVRLPRGLGEVLGDQRAVQQMLLNLLANAIKFTPEGGSVSVGAARGEGKVRIIVDDTGIGIDAQDLARLGQPFMQIQNDYTRQCQGTGLGLSLVKGLVRLHGGSMSIESAPGLGTTVTVTLPAAGQGAGAPDERVTRLETKGEKGENHEITLHKIA